MGMSGHDEKSHIVFIKVLTQKLKFISNQHVGEGEVTRKLMKISSGISQKAHGMDEIF
jgi:hypothetical protein